MNNTQTQVSTALFSLFGVHHVANLKDSEKYSARDCGYIYCYDEFVRIQHTPALNPELFIQLAQAHRELSDGNEAATPLYNALFDAIKVLETHYNQL